MDAETNRTVFLIIIGALIGLIPTFISFILTSWIGKIRTKTAIIRKFKFALSTYLLRVKTLKSISPVHVGSWAAKHLKDVYEDFLNNAGLFNKYETFHFYWLCNLILEEEHVSEIFYNINKEPAIMSLLGTTTKKDPELISNDNLLASLIKNTYEFLCFAESPFKRPFSYFWHSYKKMKLNTKALDDFMRKKVNNIQK